MLKRREDKIEIKSLSGQILTIFFSGRIIFQTTIKTETWEERQRFLMSGNNSYILESVCFYLMSFNNKKSYLMIFRLFHSPATSR